MKYFLIALITQVFTFQALAAVYEAQIHAIDKGTRGEAHLVLLSDGHVAFLEGPNKTLLEEAEESQRKEEWVKVILDENLNLVSIEPVPARETRSEIPSEEVMSYDPSIISYGQAQRVFRNMRRDYQNKSQCYNRAHVWTYEEYRRSSLKSNKLFLFFTSKYIRAYRYHWWFHVTPMVYVGGASQSNWRALDRRYTRGPLTTRTWTNVFMHNDAQCPVVSKYSDYRQNQQKEWCYLIPTSMYFWQPRDIDRYERTGYQKSSYINSEVGHAYWEAF